MSPLRYFIPRQSREHLAPFRASRAGASPLKSSPVRSSGFAFRSAAASGFTLDPLQAATANSRPLVGGQQPKHHTPALAQKTGQGQALAIDSRRRRSERSRPRRSRPIFCDRIRYFLSVLPGSSTADRLFQLDRVTISIEAATASSKGDAARKLQARRRGIRSRSIRHRKSGRHRSSRTSSRRRVDRRRRARSSNSSRRADTLTAGTYSRPPP